MVLSSDSKEVEILIGERVKDLSSVKIIPNSDGRGYGIFTLSQKDADNVQADSAEKVSQNWEEIKLKEKGGNKTVLAGVPGALPALIKANRIQEKAANVGFDWEEPHQVWEKLKEEIGEVEQEMTSGNTSDLEGEFGDLLFAVVNAARLYGVNPENALERTNRKFISRFNYLEQKAKDQGVSLRDMTLAQMDEFWNEAKTFEE